MEYLIMRKAITAVSITMLGASILIFISVLFISRQRPGSFSAGDSPTEVRPEFVAAPEKVVETPPPEQKRSLDVTRQPQLSVKPTEGEAAQDDDASARKPAVHPGALPPQQAVSEAAALRIHDKPQNLVSPKQAEEEKSLSRRGPVSLFVLGEGAFSPGVAKPEAAAQQAIDKIIPLIQERATDKVIIEGHADRSIPGGFTPRQAWKWNKIISMLRAKAIAQLLKQKGVAGDRIIVKGLGDAVPLASNLTRKGRSKNRRVEIILSPARH